MNKPAHNNCYTNQPEQFGMGLDVRVISGRGLDEKGSR